MSIQRIVLIGTGKVAQHLGTQLVAQGRTIAQVYGRRRAASEALAHSLGATATQDWQQLYPDADLYLLAISDRALPHVLEAWPDAIRQRALIAHTSGATPATVLAPYCARYGVFYPLQSFSPDRPANFHQSPSACSPSRQPINRPWSNSLGTGAAAFTSSTMPSAPPST